MAADDDQEQNESDRRTFLRVAESVLLSAHFPLKAREIVERGIERGLFGDHVLGRTPEKSMQARLSLEILSNKNESRFVRTGRGRFTLRSRLQQGVRDDNDETLKEYTSVPRSLSMPVEDVLCVLRSNYAPILTFQGLDANRDEVLPALLKLPPVYIARTEVESIDTVKQFITYVIVQCGHRVLSFERSYLSRAAEFLRGSKCIGFGGHVTAADDNIFSAGDRGIADCARRELIEELRLVEDPKASAKSQIDETTRLFRRAPLELIGVLNDDSSEVGRKHVAVVYRLWLEDWSKARHLTKGDSSIRKLEWVDLTSSALELNDFEYWSQLCVRRMYPSTSLASTTLKVVNHAAIHRSRNIVVAGRVGSGKSATARYIASKYGVGVVNSGEVLQGLMNSEGLAEIGRAAFQAKALDFIRQTDGPKKLAHGIRSAIGDRNGCIIDGLRQLETYNELRSLLGGELAMIYVQTPPDVAYELYRTRELRDGLDFPYREFLKLYDADVEVEISSLGRLADAYIYNATGLDQLKRAVDHMEDIFPWLLTGQGTEMADGLVDTRSSA